MLLRRWTLWLLCLGALGGTFARAEVAAKLPKPTSYVSDFANVMDAASKQQIEELCTQVNDKAHAQIAVVTVHDTGDEEISAFTHELQQAWGVGTKGTDRGITMVFAISTRKRWIEVSFGLEGILNDAKVGDIGRTMVPDLQAGQYGPAALLGVRSIAQVIATDANVTLDAPTAVPVQTYHRVPARSGVNGFALGRLIFFGIIVLFVLFSRGRGGRGGGGGGGLMWFLLGSMMGGGGGRGDGGGDSGGGGGGGFGGFGGGDSGGGGAGGDW